MVVKNSSKQDEKTCLKHILVFIRRFSFKGKMPDYSSDCFFSSDYNPHTDRFTF